MNKIDWKSKLTSRKFWAAVASFVTLLIIAFKGSEATATQVTAIIMAGATVIAYIFGEGLVDASRAEGTVINTSDVDASGPVGGTVSDTAITTSTAADASQADQTQQVTAGLDDAPAK